MSSVTRAKSATATLNTMVPHVRLAFGGTLQLAGSTTPGAPMPPQSPNVVLKDSARYDSSQMNTRDANQVATEIYAQCSTYPVVTATMGTDNLTTMSSFMHMNFLRYPLAGTVFLAGALDPDLGGEVVKCLDRHGEELANILGHGVFTATDGPMGSVNIFSAGSFQKKANIHEHNNSGMSGRRLIFKTSGANDLERDAHHRAEVLKFTGPMPNYQCRRALISTRPTDILHVNPNANTTTLQRCLANHSELGNPSKRDVILSAPRGILQTVKRDIDSMAKKFSSRVWWHAPSSDVSNSMLCPLVCSNAVSLQQLEGRLLNPFWSPNTPIEWTEIRGGNPANYTNLELFSADALVLEAHLGSTAIMMKCQIDDHQGKEVILRAHGAGNWPFDTDITKVKEKWMQFVQRHRPFAADRYGDQRRQYLDKVLSEATPSDQMACIEQALTKSQFYLFIMEFDPVLKVVMEAQKGGKKIHLLDGFLSLFVLTPRQRTCPWLS